MCAKKSKKSCSVSPPFSLPFTLPYRIVRKGIGFLTVLRKKKRACKSACKPVFAPYKNFPDGKDPKKTLSKKVYLS